MNVRGLRKTLEVIRKAGGLTDEPYSSIDAYVVERIWWALSYLINGKNKMAPYELADCFADEDGELLMAALSPCDSARMEEVARYCNGSPNWQTDSVFCYSDSGYFDNAAELAVTLGVSEDEAKWVRRQRIENSLPDVIGEKAKSEVADFLDDAFNDDDCNQSCVLFFVSERLGRLSKTVREHGLETSAQWKGIVKKCDELSWCFDLGRVVWQDDRCVIAGYVFFYTDYFNGFEAPNAACLVIPQLIDAWADTLEKKMKKLQGVCPGKGENHGINGSEANRGVSA